MAIWLVSKTLVALGFLKPNSWSLPNGKNTVRFSEYNKMTNWPMRPKDRTPSDNVPPNGGEATSWKVVICWLSDWVDRSLNPTIATRALQSCSVNKKVTSHCVFAPTLSREISNLPSFECKPCHAIFSNINSFIRLHFLTFPPHNPSISKLPPHHGRRW